MKGEPGLFEVACPFCGVILHQEDFKDHLIWEHLDRLKELAPP